MAHLQVREIWTKPDARSPRWPMYHFSAQHMMKQKYMFMKNQPPGT